MSYHQLALPLRGLDSRDTKFVFGVIAWLKGQAAVASNHWLLAAWYYDRHLRVIEQSLCRAAVYGRIPLRPE